MQRLVAHYLIETPRTLAAAAAAIAGAAAFGRWDGQRAPYSFESAPAALAPGFGAFGALLVVVLGSLAGQWLSVKQMLSPDAWFYLGHSGYEYIDLGRAWQEALHRPVRTFRRSRGLKP